MHLKQRSSGKNTLASDAKYVAKNAGPERSRELAVFMRRRYVTRHSVRRGGRVAPRRTRNAFSPRAQPWRSAHLAFRQHLGSRHREDIHIGKGAHRLPRCERRLQRLAAGANVTIVAASSCLYHTPSRPRRHVPKGARRSVDRVAAFSDRATRRDAGSDNGGKKERKKSRRL